MMGITNGDVAGMATRTTTGSSNIPEDWDNTITPEQQSIIITLSGGSDDEQVEPDDQGLNGGTISGT